MQSAIFAGMTLLASQGAAGATIDLAEWLVRIDADLYGTGIAAPPGQVDTSAFDFSSGLGTLATQVAGDGAHFVGWYFDHEIDQLSNLWGNEMGSATGTPTVGQTWEIDEPGFGQGGGAGPYVGDIYDNLDLSSAAASLLDNLVFANATGSIPGPDDVSMALGWNFLLDIDEVATIRLTVSETPPTGGFYLTQKDSGTGAQIYLYGSLGVVAAPAPATLLLVASGLLCLGGSARKRSR